MRTSSLIALPLACLVAAAPSVAQTVRLSAVGGSYPGQLQWVLGPGQPAKQCAVIISASPGPTPLFPIDPRVLSVGLESIGSTAIGFYDPTGGNLHRWPRTPFSIPAQVALLLERKGFVLQRATEPDRLIVSTASSRIGELTKTGDLWWFKPETTNEWVIVTNTGDVAAFAAARNGEVSTDSQQVARP